MNVTIRKPEDSCGKCTCNMFSFRYLSSTSFRQDFYQIAEAFRFDSCWINLGSFMLLNLLTSNLVSGYRSMFLRNRIKGLFHSNPSLFLDILTFQSHYLSGWPDRLVLFSFVYLKFVSIWR